MINDRIRVAANTEALRRTIFPGAIVVEIGAGTGIFSMLACRFGAKHVFAIETNEAIEVAVKSAKANGYADRITFIQKASTDVDLPERADILLSDLRGVLPPHRMHIPSVIDARTRFLKPGGFQIPQRDHLLIALVGNSKYYEEETHAWEFETDGLDWADARRIIVNQWWRAPVIETDLISSINRFITLDYTQIQSPSVSGSAQFTPSAVGICYGFVLAFEAELHGEIRFTTSPAAPLMIYERAFFPLESPLPVSPDDVVRISLSADLIGNDYVWSWKTFVNGAQRFAQSTFRAEQISPHTFRRSASNYRPSVSTDGVLVRWILERMDGQRTNQELAEELQSSFPGKFPSFRSALHRVVDTVRNYGGDGHGSSAQLNIEK